MYDTEIVEIWKAINCIILELQQLQQAVKELNEIKGVSQNDYEH